MENLENNNISPESPRMPEPDKSSVGAMIGIVIVIVLLIAGAFYFYRQESAPVETPQSVEDIEEDLNSEDYDNLDAEFEQSLDAEI